MYSLKNENPARMDSLCCWFWLVVHQSGVWRSGNDFKVRLELWDTTGDVAADETSATVSAKTVLIHLAAVKDSRPRLTTAMIVEATATAVEIVMVAATVSAAVTGMAVAALAAARAAVAAVVVPAAVAVSTACPLRLSAPAKAS